MVGDHSVYSLFVSGASNGSLSRFHCKICRRDVSMQSRGARGFIRQFSSDRHWLRDVAYSRVQKKLPVFNRLMEPLELTAKQRAEYLNQDAVEEDEGFSFSEDLLQACTRVDSTVPLLTMVNCIAELCKCGGRYTLLRNLWGNCRANLGPENSLYNLRWNHSETLVSEFCCFCRW